MTRLVILSCVLLVYCFTEISSLKCNMCIGSTTSDCAKNVQSSMVIQTCIDMNKFVRGPPPPPGWQPRHDSTTPLPPLPSEEENDVEDIATSTEPATVSAGSADNEDSDDDNSSENHHHHHHHDPHHHHHHRRPKLDAMCAYVKLKPEPSNSTGFVDRTCVYLPKKFDLCKYLNEKLKNVDACKTCTSDQCN